MILKINIFRHFRNYKVFSFLNYFHFSNVSFCTLFLITILKAKETLNPLIKLLTNIAWSILNPYIFFDTKENSFSCMMNLCDDHQNSSIFIALRTARDGGWVKKFWQIPPSSSPVTLSGGADRCGGNQD